MEDGGEEDELWTMAENIAKCQWQEPRLRNFPCHPMIHSFRLHPFFPFPRSQVPKSESVLPPPHPCLAAQASSLDATSFRAHKRGPPQGSPAPGATLSRHFDDDDDDHNHNHGLQLPPSPNLVRSLLRTPTQYSVLAGFNPRVAQCNDNIAACSKLHLIDGTTLCYLP
ncbi:hypothetical protein CNYM01_02083 [Colletotrichum nymphaeae SA-01]|uniref:Uncharacterized protein n=1 Tax=Colletotrichum nymphaeae SA-01 TaxID=1460502 RepID=A0A135S472_9PEZI|nr:hypothetical protein CNYM01_02083 [Colletotrichum nymphaeae SA-01]